MKKSSNSHKATDRASPSPPAAFHSGFVSLLAPPNAGKSTLLNALIGQKIAITSPKPNTTRTRVTGIYTDARQQIVILDTPGLLRDATGLNARLVARALDTVADVDAAILLHDVTHPWADILTETAQTLRDKRCAVIVALTKIDLLDTMHEMLPLIEEAARVTGSERIIPLCAPKRQGLDELLDAIYTLLPEGPRYFDADSVTDQPERVIVGELIRETLFYTTRQEIPYASAVEVEEFRESDAAPRAAAPQRERVYIRACIYVERSSQKGIVIGKGGAMLRTIGTKARTHIERFLGTPVYLELVVRVAPKWRTDERFLSRLGY